MKSKSAILAQQQEYAASLAVLSDTTMSQACALLLSEKDYNNDSTTDNPSGGEKETQTDSTNNTTPQKSDQTKLLEIYQKCREALTVIQTHQKREPSRPPIVPSLGGGPLSGGGGTSLGGPLSIEQQLQQSQSLPPHRGHPSRLQAKPLKPNPIQTQMPTTASSLASSGKGQFIRSAVGRKDPLSLGSVGTMRGNKMTKPHSFQKPVPRNRIGQSSVAGAKSPAAQLGGAVATSVGSSGAPSSMNKKARMTPSTPASTAAGSGGGGKSGGGVAPPKSALNFLAALNKTKNTNSESSGSSGSAGLLEKDAKSPSLATKKAIESPSLKRKRKQQQSPPTLSATTSAGTGGAPVSARASRAKRRANSEGSESHNKETNEEPSPPISARLSRAQRRAEADEQPSLPTSARLSRAQRRAEADAEPSPSTSARLSRAQRRAAATAAEAGKKKKPNSSSNGSSNSSDNDDSSAAEVNFEEFEVGDDVFVTEGKFHYAAIVRESFFDDHGRVASYTVEFENGEVYEEVQPKDVYHKDAELAPRND